METQDSQHTHIIEISRQVPAGKLSPRGNKVCGGAACGFSDAANGTDAANERSASMKKLWMAVILCVLFMGAEVAGGIEANSLAILTDAAHLLSDVTAFGISLFSLWVSGWEATPRQSYGFFRVEILGALVSIQLIWLLVGILVYKSIDRIIHDNGEVKGFWMFVVAAFGLVVNIIMALLLGHDHAHGHGGHDHAHGHGGHDHGGDHGHEHDHSSRTNMHHHLSHSKHEKEHHRSKHDEVHPELGEDKNGGEHSHKDEREHCHARREGFHDESPVYMHEREHRHGPAATKGAAPHDDELKKPLLSHAEGSCCPDGSRKADSKRKQKGRNINVQAAYLHVLGDSIQSIGVMISGAIIWWKPQWQIIDLICTLFFSLTVLGTTIRMLRNILEVLMESTPREIDAKRLEQGLCEMEEVEAVHELHIWAITVGKILLACHVKIKPAADADMVLDNVIGYIQREYNISHVTIQIER